MTQLHVLCRHFFFHSYHYYVDLNVLDWGRGEQLAVALGRAVYLLDTKKGGINNLCELQPDSLYVTSLKWNRTGKYLAIGTSDAEVQVCTYR